MNIGFIGAGMIGKAVSTQLAKAGHDVLVSNSRDPETLRETFDPLGISVGTAADAASRDIVFLAVAWRDIPTALAGVDLAGKTLIDTNNPIIMPGFTRADTGGKTSSEVIQDLAPGAHVVKAFNHMLHSSYDEGPTVDGAPKVLFHSSDHDDAHAVAAQLIEDLGYVPINLGGLVTGGVLHESPGALAGRVFVEPAARRG
ncbi:NADPH-dependent F420 reductase [Mycobacterium kyogaense]|uniref:NADPH-dependent F420 reductase n=1 Tax=Mycobacterium kyogaense TaxID=2212479 RepID=UPI000DAE9722|nr:NAD(P)-binding domain-containing protein [Mycobacterium kyogaense]